MSKPDSTAAASSKEMSKQESASKSEDLNKESPQNRHVIDDLLDKLATAVSPKF